MLKIQISSDALTDLDEGFWFYEEQEPGLGDYFSNQLGADIDRLRQSGGTHRQPYRSLYRALSKNFPYSIYYRLRSCIVLVVAVVDCRREPEWIAEHLRQGER